MAMVVVPVWSANGVIKKYEIKGRRQEGEQRSPMPSAHYLTPVLHCYSKLKVQGLRQTEVNIHPHKDNSLNPVSDILIPQHPEVRALHARNGSITQI